MQKFVKLWHVVKDKLLFEEQVKIKSKIRVYLQLLKRKYTLFRIN